MEYTIREIQKQEYPLLDNFLYEADQQKQDIQKLLTLLVEWDIPNAVS